VGHALTAKYLGAEQGHVVETALWDALRALEESSSLSRRMAERATGSRHQIPAQLYRERASNTEANTGILRDSLLQVSVDNHISEQGEPRSPMEQFPT
jgi:two-component system chemotaxis response regulator CheB